MFSGGFMNMPQQGFLQMMQQGQGQGQTPATPQPPAMPQGQPQGSGANPNSPFGGMARGIFGGGGLGGLPGGFGRGGGRPGGFMGGAAGGPLGGLGDMFGQSGLLGFLPQLLSGIEGMPDIGALIQQRMAPFRAQMDALPGRINSAVQGGLSQIPQMPPQPQTQTQPPPFGGMFRNMFGG